ncbi:MAG: GreA/GreB family elongation factor [Candidatus Limnocylindria bacterium]
MTALAAMIERGEWNAREWPMTREAWNALDADATRLNEQVLAKDGYVTGRLDGEVDAPTFVPNIVGQQLLRQLNNVRQVLERGVVVEDPDVAVIGHRVTLRELDSATSTYALVIPGEGDPRNGWVSVDSPVGSALLGRRVGELVTISAPAGSWTATVIGIE